MIRLALILLLALGTAASAQVKYGILSNDSRLPLVFPLQIKSDPGRDLLIALRKPDSWDVAYTARVRGGSIFRVLVPVGTYMLEVIPEDAASERYIYPAPLTFRIEGLDRKLGNRIDLRGTVPVQPQTIGLCQSLHYDTYDLDDLRDYWRLPYDDPDRPKFPPSPQVSERLCD